MGQLCPAQEPNGHLRKEGSSYRSGEYQDKKLTQTIPPFHLAEAPFGLGQLCLRPLSPHTAGGQQPDRSLPEGDLSSVGTSAYRTISWRYHFSSLTRRAQDDTCGTSSGNLRAGKCYKWQSAGGTGGVLDPVSGHKWQWGKGFGRTSVKWQESPLSQWLQPVQLDRQNGFSQQQSKVPCHTPGSPVHAEFRSCSFTTLIFSLPTLCTCDFEYTQPQETFPYLMFTKQAEIHGWEKHTSALSFFSLMAVFK